MREDQEEETKTLCVCVCEPLKFVQARASYRFHWSKAVTPLMKQVEVQIEKWGRRPSEDAPREKQAVPVGSVAWWEEMLLIWFVFPSYCHFLCSWSRVEKERKTRVR